MSKRSVRVSPDARPEYVAAFRAIVDRIAASLAHAPTRMLPIKMFVAGGAAMHFYTGERVSHDIDAVFSHRFALPDKLDASYRDADGAARHLYLDTQYNDTFGLLHQDANDDALALELPGLDAARVSIHLLAPVDLAVSKVARFGEQDRTDIAALAHRGLITAPALRKRALEALGGYVGEVARIRLSIDLACKLVQASAPSRPLKSAGRSRKRAPR